jgi:hypothetical protein
LREIHHGLEAAYDRMGELGGLHSKHGESGDKQP